MIIGRLLTPLRGLRALLLPRIELSVGRQARCFRRPSRSPVSSLLAHLLIRLLVIGPLPAELQAYAALYPFSVLVPLLERQEAPGEERSGVEPPLTVSIGEEGIRQYLYDDTSTLLEYDGSGGQVAKYDWGSDRLISLFRRDEPRRFYSFDALGSVTNLTDDSGSAVASYHLDAWGNYRFPDELNSSRNRFGFTGYLFDPETDLYYAKARFYDPEVGRFTTQDSFLGAVDDPPSLHRYFYASGNPTRYIDPTGHQFKELAEPAQGAATFFFGLFDPTTPQGAALQRKHQEWVEFQQMLAVGSLMFAQAFDPGRMVEESVRTTLLPGEAARQRQASGARLTAEEQLQLQLLGVAEKSEALGPRLAAATGALLLQPFVGGQEVTGLRDIEAATDPTLSRGERVQAALSGALKATTFLFAARAGMRPASVSETAATAEAFLNAETRSMSAAEGSLARIQPRPRVAPEAVSGSRRQPVVAGASPGEVAALETGAPSSAERLGGRRLGSPERPSTKYQVHVTGRATEEMWRVGAEKVAVDARRAGYTVEAKWTGRNDAAWRSSQYNPSHEFYNEAKVLDQARRLIELDRATGGRGARYAVSNAAARNHFEALFRRRFPGDNIQVWHVPGTGMR